MTTFDLQTNLNINNHTMPFYNIYTLKLLQLVLKRHPDLSPHVATSNDMSQKFSGNLFQHCVNVLGLQSHVFKSLPW